MAPKKTDFGSSAEEPDIDYNTVEQRLNIWLNTPGAGRVGGTGVNPIVIRLHRAFAALTSVQTALKERHDGPLLEFIWVFGLLRPTLVRISPCH